ncbi:DUF3842 family protein [Alkaliphilus pronyensis]|uniref:DUF3842 family protein n=1 Tax=Alkaliphilus pronyensis TaxID=1482732 RepID=A0A6I0EX14_9FIRM|nr:DUF3842 family protein [Alkaliphilus pronyensis]KAB3532770.1 DUF3842 family protein [Alkaliphilus pronyensis]
MRIAVIDGQGGGIGKAIIEKIKAQKNKDISVLALGTNTMATTNMLKAGADEGATGENPIVYNSDKVDVIVGAVGIISPNSILGELTPLMAKAIGESNALKILIPYNKCNIYITGVVDESLQYHVDCAVKKILSVCSK